MAEIYRANRVINLWLAPTAIEIRTALDRKLLGQPVGLIYS